MAIGDAISRFIQGHDVQRDYSMKLEQLAERKAMLEREQLLGEYNQALTVFNSPDWQAVPTNDHKQAVSVLNQYESKLGFQPTTKLKDVFGEVFQNTISDAQKYGWNNIQFKTAATTRIPSHILNQMLAQMRGSSTLFNSNVRNTVRRFAGAASLNDMDDDDRQVLASISGDTELGQPEYMPQQRSTIPKDAEGRAGVATQEQQLAQQMQEQPMSNDEMLDMIADNIVPPQLSAQAAATGLMNLNKLIAQDRDMINIDTAELARQYYIALGRLEKNDTWDAAEWVRFNREEYDKSQRKRKQDYDELTKEAGKITTSESLAAFTAKVRSSSLSEEDKRSLENLGSGTLESSIRKAYYEQARTANVLASTQNIESITRAREFKTLTDLAQWGADDGVTDMQRAQIWRMFGGEGDPPPGYATVENMTAFQRVLSNLRQDQFEALEQFRQTNIEISKARLELSRRRQDLAERRAIEGVGNGRFTAHELEAYEANINGQLIPIATLKRRVTAAYNNLREVQKDLLPTEGAIEDAKAAIELAEDNLNAGYHQFNIDRGVTHPEPTATSTQTTQPATGAQTPATTQPTRAATTSASTAWSVKPENIRQNTQPPPGSSPGGQGYMAYAQENGKYVNFNGIKYEKNQCKTFVKNMLYANGKVLDDRGNKLNNPTKNSIKVGDVLQLKNGSHWVMVIPAANDNKGLRVLELITAGGKVQGVRRTRTVNELWPRFVAAYRPTATRRGNM